MARAAHLDWNELDLATRERLDRQYLRDLSLWNAEGLTDEGVRVYLDFRRGHHDVALTTYEEGRLRKLLRPHIDRSRLPDPSETEEHVGWLERFGASQHLTNDETYLRVIGTVLLIGIVGLMLYAIL